MGKRLLSFLTICLFAVSMAFAQKQITGTVVDKATGEPIVGASVLVKGTTVGAATDINGNFTIKNVPQNAKTLSVSYIGMLPTEVAIKNGLKIQLVSDAKSLDDVMVVAFGTATKESFTGSAKVVGAEELSKSQVSNVTSALAGAVPGLTLTSTSGAPGESPSIRIRGFSSINAGNSPLIIVDGAPYPGDLNNINPTDVESMTVLKDAASTALYGARGGNGVILITTKGGKKTSDARITFDAKYGWGKRSLPNYDVVTSPELYYETQYSALNNYYKNLGYDANGAWTASNSAILGQLAEGGLGYNIWTLPEGQALIGSNGKLNPYATLGRVVDYNGEQYLWTPDDWEKAGTRTGKRQEYNVSINGSSDKGNYYMNIGYLNQAGITEKSNMERFTARLRADYQVKKWLKVGGNFNYARFDFNSLSNNGSDTSSGNIWAFVYQMAPIYPAYIRNADGSIKVDANGINMMDYGYGLNAGGQRPFIYDANPIQDVRLNAQNAEGNAMSGNGFADFKITKDLTLTVNGSFNLDETRGTYYYNPYYGQFDTTGGTLTKYHTRSYNYNLQQLLNYNKTFADVHNVGVLLGHEYYDNRYAEIAAGKSQMFSDKNLELDGAVKDDQSASSNKSRFNTEGWFGRLQYDYDTKYFVSASLRRDASSNFAPEHRWGTFWSAGAAWLINKENFFHADWVDQLKLKVAYGQNGNDGIGSYRYTDLYLIENSGGEVGTRFDGKGNRDISWEKISNLNAGIEFSLFGDKLQGSLEYYNRKTTDMLYFFSVAPSLGYSGYYDNVGDMVNTGVELDLQYSIIRRKNVNWDVNFNISTNKNKITRIPDDNKNAKAYDLAGNEYEGFVSGSFFRYEGSSIYGWNLREFAGIYTNNNFAGNESDYTNIFAAMGGNSAASEAAQKAIKDEAEKVAGTYNAKNDGLAMWYQRKSVNVFDTEGKKLYYVDGNEGETTTEELKENGDKRNPVLAEALVKTTKASEATYFVNKESTLPKFFGGFGTSFQAYGFDFSIHTSFAIGGKTLDATYQQFMSCPTASNAGFNFHKDVFNAWSPENSEATAPRWQYDDLYRGSSSTYYLTNASYLNIDNINIGYTFPKSWLKAAQIESLRLYCAAENVYMFSARKGFNPNQTYGGGANGTRYPLMRTISAGITLTF